MSVIVTSPGNSCVVAMLAGSASSRVIKILNYICSIMYMLANECLAIIEVDAEL